MNALAGSDLEVMVVIPNDQLSAMNYYDRAKDWVKHSPIFFHSEINSNSDHAPVFADIQSTSPSTTLDPSNTSPPASSLSSVPLPAQSPMPTGKTSRATKPPS
ncbi:hypothetical protein H5410_014247 [Solanum commersonii]|uniref:Uncharacterized protein n=1 Tax=Solanum commersonii TaxID=4109 RepID=A0A9J5ZQV6_SOLCO|nr:hypothetical protein H5410_014247 [Solanum commersonii]